MVWVEKIQKAMYSCMNPNGLWCEGSASAHQADGAPMGSAVKNDIKKLRHDAHREFDFLYAKKYWFKNRREAYAALSAYFGRVMHIAEMTDPEDFKKLHEFCVDVKSGKISNKRSMDTRTNVRYNT